MANDVFSATNEQNNKINRSTFDWRHVNNMTMKFGYVYPFLSWLLPANSSLKIRASASLQFMPMVFPAQTSMKTRVSFFKVPLRTLWKDHKDYVGNFRKGLEEPYLDLAYSFPKFMGTGKLADYLDIPTTLSGRFTGNTVILGDDNSHQYMRYIGTMTTQSEHTMENKTYGVGQYFKFDISPTDDTIVPAAKLFMFGQRLAVRDGSLVAGYYSIDSFIDKGDVYTIDSTYEDFSQLGELSNVTVLFIQVKDDKIVSVQPIGSCPSFDYSLENATITFTPEYNMSSQIVVEDIGVTCYIVFAAQYDKAVLGSINNLFKSVTVPSPNPNYYLRITTGDTSSKEEGVTSEINRYSSPYFDSSMVKGIQDRQIKLSAYRPRAYEAIYNSYLRDNRNNPYYIDGEVQYNVWIPTDKGGADTYPYELRRANWEKDFLTTAVSSPQQGRAPLVGLTTYDSIGENGEHQLRSAIVDEDGKRYAVNYEVDENGIKSVSYAEMDGTTGLQALSFRQLVDAASTGISIPDLRAVNAYQKFLELNMRKGFSYKEIIEGRFDCQVRYDDLNIPEFLGGYTREVSMNRVVQSVEKGDGTGEYADALGSLAGDAFLSSGDVPTISCFCDEECIVMGIISIVPQANYSQLLPKDYLYRDLLDHFQPEFNNLGFQPITYKEVCPVQAFNSGMDLNTVYGYQRPWYEFVQKVDTVHGNFRTNLRNFLINRVFDTPPALTESFLLVDPKQVNDIFAVKADTDKILGQIYIDCEASLPVARVAIPRLD